MSTLTVTEKYRSENINIRIKTGTECPGLFLWARFDPLKALPIKNDKNSKFLSKTVEKNIIR